MDRGGKGKTAIPEEEKADEPSILPMTPESKQLAPTRHLRSAPASCDSLSTDEHMSRRHKCKQAIAQLAEAITLDAINTSKY